MFAWLFAVLILAAWIGLAVSQSMAVVAYIFLGGLWTFASGVLAMMATCGGNGCEAGLFYLLAWPFAVVGHMAAALGTHRRMRRAARPWWKEAGLSSLWILGLMAPPSFLIAADSASNLLPMAGAMSPVLILVALQAWREDKGRSPSKQA